MSKKINFKVDWNDAPDWALFHHFQKNGNGIWKGLIIHPDKDYHIITSANSGNKIPENSNWQNSITLRPKGAKKTGKFMPYSIHNAIFLESGWEERIKKQFEI
jgi:hypothetical protein